jgi:type VI secretion system protein ImpG
VGAPGRAAEAHRQFLPATSITPVGYADDEAMLPVTLPGLSGMRLLQEYFAFPERYLFVDLNGLRPALSRIKGSTIEIVLLFSRPGQGLEGAVTVDNFALHCVPAVNLFPKRADRIQVDEGRHEFHVVPDRTAPLDFEVFDVLGVQGYDEAGAERHFQPLYAPEHRSVDAKGAYFTIWREPRLMSERARREGPRSGYVGSEVFLSLVDPDDAPFPDSMRQLAVQTRCTNRDLPVFMTTGASQGDYAFNAGVPLESVRVLAGPSRPYTALRHGGVAWRLLNLLSLNYLSLLDTEGGEATVAMRDLLGHFPQGGEPPVRRQIEALSQVSARPVVRRHPVKGPIAFSRGIEVRLTVDELGYTGTSAYLFGAAMHHYLTRHASMNSFVETVLSSLTRGDVARWRPASGTRPVI